MGQQKQLLPLGSRTIIEHCVQTMLTAGLSDIAVVINPQGAKVFSAIEHLPVAAAINPDSNSDMAASVRIGLNALKEQTSAVLVCPGDHPLVLPETMQALLSRHQKYPEAILIPSHNRRRGHPTLFPRGIIQEIYTSRSLRDIVSNNETCVQYLDVQDRGVLLDMDTPEDYALILQEYAAQKENQ